MFILVRHDHRLLSKKAPRSQHLEFYLSWVRSEQNPLSEIAAPGPNLSNELHLEKHVVYTALHCDGMAALENVGSGNSGTRIPEILARSAGAGKTSSKFR
jgi:hypothetical protein